MLIKFGGIIAEARGTLGGTVFSRNGSGAIARAWTKPVNPNTGPMQRAKNFFSAASAHWNAGVMTEAQRTAWRTYAAGVKWLNKLGETIILNGNSVFIQSGIARLTAGLTVLLDGPTTLTQASADETFTVVADEANQELSISFDDTREWDITDGGAMTLFMGQPQNAGSLSFSGPYTLAGSILGQTSVPLTSPQTIAAPFAVVEGQRITVRARICEIDGRVSKYFQSSGLAVA
jgi:hypothetical protein